MGVTVIIPAACCQHITDAVVGDLPASLLVVLQARQHTLLALNLQGGHSDCNQGPRPASTVSACSNGSCSAALLKSAAVCHDALLDIVCCKAWKDSCRILGINDCTEQGLDAPSLQGLVGIDQVMLLFNSS